MGFTASLIKLCLCALIFLSGLCKLTPKWGDDVYASMDNAFRERFTPFWQENFFAPIGVALDATVVKCIFGSTEVLCAVLLYTSYKVVSAIILFGLMSFVVLTHIFLGEWAHLPVPLLLCFTSLGVCYIGEMPPAFASGGRKAKAS